MNDILDTNIEIRNEEVDGLGPWYWPVSDTGAWDGPKRDWEEYHKDRYFMSVRNFGTIISVGACCGMYVRHYAKKFKHVLAFEPDPLNFRCLVLNNSTDNIKFFNAAMGNQVAQVHLKNDDKVNVGVHEVFRSYGPYDTQMLTIDSLELTECDVIQMDVEGYEYPVLLGALKTIEKFRPVIIAERNNSVEETVKLMATLKYAAPVRSAADSVYAPLEFDHVQEVFLPQG